MHLKWNFHEYDFLWRALYHPSLYMFLLLHVAFFCAMWTYTREPICQRHTKNVFEHTWWKEPWIMSSEYGFSSHRTKQSIISLMYMPGICLCLNVWNHIDNGKNCTSRTVSQLWMRFNGLVSKMLQYESLQSTGWDSCFRILKESKPDNVKQ